MKINKKQDFTGLGVRGTVLISKNKDLKEKKSTKNALIISETAFKQS
jgi:hypothetical protein